MNSTLIHGVHGPNTSWTVPDYRTLAASGARWVKLLATAHTALDARVARALGCRVLVRSPGETTADVNDLAATIATFGPLADVYELGNEPATTADDLYQHAWFLDACYARFGATHALIPPGWRMDCAPPLVGARYGDLIIDDALSRRLAGVYQRFAAGAIHAYDVWDLTAPGVQAHIAAWAAWYGGRPLYLTEYGLAGPLPASDRAARYAAFLGTLPAQTVAACAFLVGGTAMYAKPPMCYRLGPAEGAALGAALA